MNTDVVEQYADEYREFVKFDSLNMEEKLFRIPEFKHLWVCRLIDSKRKRFAAIKNKKKIKDAFIKKMIEEKSVISLNKQTLDDMEHTDEISAINDNIAELDTLIEFLELCVKNVSFIGNDMKNIIDLKRLEYE